MELQWTIDHRPHGRIRRDADHVMASMSASISSAPSSTTDCRRRRSCRTWSRSIPPPRPATSCFTACRVPALQSDRFGAWRLCRDPPGFRDGTCGSYCAARRHRLHHARIQDLLHQGHDGGHRPRAQRGQDAQRRPPRRHRRGTHHRRKRPAARACNDDVPGFEIPKGT